MFPSHIGAISWRSTYDALCTTKEGAAIKKRRGVQNEIQFLFSLCDFSVRFLPSKRGIFPSHDFFGGNRHKCAETPVSTNSEDIPREKKTKQKKSMLKSRPFWFEKRTMPDFPLFKLSFIPVTSLL